MCSILPWSQAGRGVWFAWFGLVLRGLAWLSLAWFGLAWLGVGWLF